MKEQMIKLPTQPLNVEELICPNIEEARKKLLIKVPKAPKKK